MDNRVAIVGAGYWGKNLIRTFNALGALVSVYDLDESLLEKYKKDSVYRDLEFGTDYTHCLDRWDINGIVVATPPNTHYEIVKTCLNKDKNVFVEKPMTIDPKESEELVELAKEKQKILMVGHIFLYSPEIIKLKEIINTDEFGDVQYVYTQRLNLGKVQKCGVIADLCPHDISIVDYLLDDHCVNTKATAANHILEDVEDIAFISMRYSKGTLVHLHLSWLDPLKVRNTVVVGTKQMVVCDSLTKKIEIYNTSIDVHDEEEIGNKSYADHLLSYKYGDIVIPFIDNVEPMQAEAEEFIKCMETGDTPLASGEVGLSVVQTVGGMKESLRRNGQWVEV